MQALKSVLKTPLATNASKQVLKIPIQAFKRTDITLAAITAGSNYVLQKASQGQVADEDSGTDKFCYGVKNYQGVSSGYQTIGTPQYPSMDKILMEAITSMNAFEFFRYTRRLEKYTGADICLMHKFCKTLSNGEIKFFFDIYSLQIKWVPDPANNPKVHLVTAHFIMTSTHNFLIRAEQTKYVLQTMAHDFAESDLKKNTTPEAYACDKYFMKILHDNIEKDKTYDLCTAIKRFTDEGKWTGPTGDFKMV
ncbi:hypothetical protein CVT24_005201 [Panaeolus cyanescens]|uniref:Uncharacterized protein n=1 Tax=Panaeolus cyanescens TaxID=181874 RepID=A0A409Y9S7_9AGAR|nr:hypothetical protein CVT24_005201 [Panaeolus cyanescens]